MVGTLRCRRECRSAIVYGGSPDGPPHSPLYGFQEGTSDCSGSTPYNNFVDRPNRLQLRRAGPGDLDSLARITQAAFPDEPEWNYRFQRGLSSPRITGCRRSASPRPTLGSQTSSLITLAVPCSSPALGIWDLAAEVEPVFWSGTGCLYPAHSLFLCEPISKGMA